MKKFRFLEKSSSGIAVLCLLVVVLARIHYSSDFARSWDAVDFALGVQSFNLLDMQPHFPGYPYFILGGMLLENFVNDPALALSVWNSVLSLSSIIPMWLIYKRYLSTGRAIIAISLSQSVPFLNIIIASPMSEGMAYTVMWWYIWSLVLALEKGKYSFDLLSLLLFSILMGVRLSYLPLSIGILIIWYKRWKEKGGAHVLEQAGVAIIFQLFWVYPLVLSVGGIGSFEYIAIEFVKGHFTGWGGSIATEKDPFFIRIITFLWGNILWVGLSLKTVVILLLYSTLVFYNVSRPLNLSNRKLWWSLLMAYTIWAFFAQNVDKPRHIIPVVVILIAILLTRALQSRSRGVLWISTILLIVQTTLSIQYVEKQATELPATYQLAQYIEQQSEPLKIYTWEEERVLQYVGVSIAFKKVQTYTLFEQDAMRQREKGRSVYVTERAVRGFSQQGVDTSSFIPVKQFESDSLFDPVYSDITLFKWIKSSSQ
ncbi:nucleoporin-interacting protein [Pontibacillus chungwhensis BH030062]|uniref:Nucleoporin-interacting protein n=1 Tax=Pontibacillus chungwhensis BH030062 TaxID=1385513 RepID=A0A0A2UVZ3_9BACI|nr:hypothetical protein [Pontibacillus chungwhensis]KGP90888.1 nucleoporin-interacting protein [Pontibacillus chungwhensis BH030062]